MEDESIRTGHLPLHRSGTAEGKKKLQNRPKVRSLTGPMAYHNCEAAQPIYQSYAENFGIVQTYLLETLIDLQLY